MYDLGGVYSISDIAAYPRADGCVSCQSMFTHIVRAGASASPLSNPLFAPGPARYVAVHGSGTLQMRALIVNGAAMAQPSVPALFTASASGGCLAANATVVAACTEAFTYRAGLLVASSTAVALPGVWQASVLGSTVLFTSGSAALAGNAQGWVLASAGAATVGLPVPGAITVWFTAASMDDGASRWADLASGRSVSVVGQVMRGVNVIEARCDNWRFGAEGPVPGGAAAPPLPFLFL